jgi:hypothetical protein
VFDQVIARLPGFPSDSSALEVTHEIFVFIGVDPLVLSVLVSVAFFHLITSHKRVRTVSNWQVRRQVTFSV